MAEIYAPNKDYTGISASVAFANGKGETDDPHLIQWFKEHGYKVVEEEEGQAEPEPESLPDFVPEEEPEPEKKPAPKKRGGK